MNKLISGQGAPQNSIVSQDFETGEKKIPIAQVKQFAINQNRAMMRTGEDMHTISMQSDVSKKHL